MGWSFVQSSFLGGLWSKMAQGRVDSPHYKTALDVCENYYPVEQGSLLRRQGTRFLSHTRRGNKGKLVPFDFSIVQPYQIEFTNLFARFYMGISHVFTDPSKGIINISTATPAVVTTSSPHGWTTGDDVIFEIGGPPCRATLLCNRQFTITVIDTVSFSIADAMTQAAIDGSVIAWTPSIGADDTVFRILELASPYTTAQLTDNKLHRTQDETTVVFLRDDVQPYVLAEGGTFFTLTPAVFLDGPYLNINTTTTTMTPSGTSGSITVTASSITGVNDGLGFQTTDIGRAIRLRSVPANWAIGTTYAIGTLVTGTDGNIYTSLTAGNIAHNPVNDINNWAVSASGIVWNWGTVTARASTTVVTVLLKGDTALLNTTATTTWRLGLFSDTTGWPTCGGFHEDRLWFGGVLGNRFDASKSGDHYNFAPTSTDGTVADDNAIAATFTAEDVNQLLWFTTQDDGMWAGTPAGIWRIRASSLDDPITPSSIQARRVIKFASADEGAISAPKTILYTQRQKRKVLEIVDLGQAKPDAINLSQTAEHLGAGGFEEISYMQEPTPMLWARRAKTVTNSAGDLRGNLAACSYKRTDENAYAGWHEVYLGSDRLADNISTGPTKDNLGETLFLITSDPDDDTAPRFVEMLTPMFDDNTEAWDAWFVDTGIVPCCASLSGNLTTGNLSFYGLHALEGESVCPFIAGIDVGPRTVSNGAVVVALGSDPDGILTGAFLTSVAGQAYDYHDTSVQVLVGVGSAPAPAVTIPSILGYIGTSTGPTGNVSGSNNSSLLVDWDNSRAYIPSLGNTTKGIVAFNLDTGARLNDETVTQLGTTEFNYASGGAFDLTKTGEFVFISHFANSSEIGAVGSALVAPATTFGAAGSSLSPSTSSRVLQPAFLMSLEQGGGSQLYQFSSLATPGEVYEYGGVLAGGLVISGVEPQETWMIPCKGDFNASWGVLYAIGTPTGAGGAGGTSTTPFSVYRINGGISLVGTVSPTQVDATWTNFTEIGGLAFDSTDGNLLTFARTTDVVTHQVYLMKLNSRTAAVMWKIAVTQIPPNADYQMNKSRIKAGTFFYLDATSTMRTINTVAGTSTSQTITGLATGGAQISDDVSNSLILFTGYSPGTLTPIGPWMGSPGNHTSVSNFWVRVFMGTIGGQDRTRLAADTIYEIGAPIGFCYRSRGRLLRPDSGNDAGAQAGSPFAKTRRLHWWGGSFYRTRSMSVGFDFDHLRPVQFRPAPNRAVIAAPTLFSGIVSTTVDDEYGFKGQLSFEQVHAYPGVITALAGFLQLTDK